MAPQVVIPGGSTAIGSDRFQTEEGPVRTVDVGRFEIDRFEVTNARFAAFVAATGYVTVAEREGGAIFVTPSRAGDTYWRLEAGANWKYPHGPRSKAVLHNPVVQVTIQDALAYAKWLGRDLPTEAEWEKAARGGLVDADYSWGDEPPTPSHPRANHWQGAFPAFNAQSDGYPGLAPIGCYEPNGYGLHDVAGNVWELTKSSWNEDKASVVIKGGSWLCADNYCLRYRPAARQAADVSLGTDHIGFRTVRRLRSR
jgi:formylglycine-generating enzyme